VATAAWRIQHRWQTQAVPVPGGLATAGWLTAGVGLDATGRISVRPDRMPGRVRLWYKTPFADRHACN
jgi:hypothetical protein